MTNDKSDLPPPPPPKYLLYTFVHDTRKDTPKLAFAKWSSIFCEGEVYIGSQIRSMNASLEFKKRSVRIIE